MKNSVELVVFDMAGTTVRDEGAVALAFQMAMSQYGYNISEAEVAPLMGYKKTVAIEKLLHECEHNADRITKNLVDKIYQRFLRIMVDYYRVSSEVAPAPDAESVFEQLRQRNIKIGLNTGFSTEISGVILNRFGWLNDKKVDGVVSSNEVPAGRPYPYMIHELMRQTGVAHAKGVIKVGDTEVDIQEGKNTGCLYSIGITTGACTREAMIPFGPSFIINDLQELIAIIDQNA